MKWLFIFIALVLPGQKEIFAGDISGNGGNGVLCYDADGALSSIELLDFYEATHLRGFNIVVQGEGVDGKIHWLLERLERLDNQRAERYRRAYQAFFEEVEWWSGQSLPATDDYGYVPIQENCKIQAIAIRRPEVGEGQKRYVIDKDLWDTLDELTKAGLVLHEIVYTHAVELGHKNSINSRYFLGVWASTHLPFANYHQYLKMLALEEESIGSLPPIWVKENPFFSVPCGSFEFPLGAFAHDPDSETLQFQSDELPTWVQLTRDGVLKGERPHQVEAYYDFMVTVTDGTFAVANRVHLGTRDCGILDSIRLAGRVEEYFWQDLKRMTGMSGFYRLINPPSWMQIAGDATIHGWPHTPGWYSAGVEIENETGTFVTGIQVLIKDRESDRELVVEEVSLEKIAVDLLYDKRLSELIAEMRERKVYPVQILKDYSKATGTGLQGGLPTHEGYTLVFADRWGDLTCTMHIRTGLTGNLKGFSGNGPCLGNFGRNFSHSLSVASVDPQSMPILLVDDLRVLSLMKEAKAEHMHLVQVFRDSSHPYSLHPDIEGYTLVYTKSEMGGDCDPEAHGMQMRLLQVRMLRGKVDSSGLSKKFTAWCDEI